MKKLLIGFLILVVFLAAVFFLLKSSKPKPGPVVFDMTYRGLSGAKDELRYNAYWGFGQREEETPFIKAVREKGGEFSTVYNSHFKEAEWSAVEVKDNKAIAFYFDLDADGKLSENEKILPIESNESDSSNRTEFVTPDFTITTRDGHKVPFRALLQVAFYGESSRPNCMWSPSCVLEGESTLNGEPVKLILFGSGFTGTFDKFGRCSYALQASEEQSGQHISRATLSSIINHEGQFYNLMFQGSYEQGQNIRVILEKYTGDKGELAVALSAQNNLKTRLSGAGITGGKDDTINFHLPHNQATLPTGTYKISSGFITYGVEADDRWRLDFKEGPEVVINADETCNVELGKPELSISAIDEKKRYHSDKEEKTVYSRGTNVYLSRIIKGKASELYGRFSEKQNDSSRYKDIQPELKILDAEGQQIVAAKIKYG